MTGPPTSTPLLALLAIFVGLFLVRAACRGGLLRAAVAAACIAIPTALFLLSRGLGGQAAPYAPRLPSVASASSAAAPVPPVPRLSRAAEQSVLGDARAASEVAGAAAEDAFAGADFEMDDPSVGQSDEIGEQPSPEEVERWKGLASALLSGISREMVERRWSDSPPLTISLGDDLIVIGQAELRAERALSGSTRREREREAKLRRQTAGDARESARRQLAEYILKLRPELTPALRDVAGILRGLSERDARELADRILDHYKPAARESTDFSADRERPVLRHAYKYEIGGEQFKSNLRRELQRIEVRAREARDRAHDSRPLHGLLTAAIIWAVIVASAATLRASARRRQPVR